MNYCTDIHKETLKFTLDDLINLTKSNISEIKSDFMDYNEHKELINGVKLLIMVAESSEYYAAMYYFVRREVNKLTDKDGTAYYVGKWGAIPAALVRHAGKSKDPTKKAIRLFRTLETIIALGVCGTINYSTGYVLVSEKIYQYYKPELPNGNIFDPSDFADPVSRIFRFLQDNYEQWSFECTEEGYKSEAKFVPMLSGTDLTASKEDKDKLIEVVNEEGFGVEMGGKGIISGLKEENKETDFIIVKGGCNYANKIKSEKWQPTAAMAAADFLYSQLNKAVYKQLFKCEGIAILVQICNHKTIMYCCKVAIVQL